MTFSDIKYYIVYCLSQSKKSIFHSGWNEENEDPVQEYLNEKAKRKKEKGFRSSQRPGNSIRENHESTHETYDYK